MCIYYKITYIQRKNFNCNDLQNMIPNINHSLRNMKLLAFFVWARAICINKKTVSWIMQCCLFKFVVVIKSFYFTECTCYFTSICVEENVKDSTLWSECWDQHSLLYCLSYLNGVWGLQGWTVTFNTTIILQTPFWECYRTDIVCTVIVLFCHMVLSGISVIELWVHVVLLTYQQS